MRLTFERTTTICCAVLALAAGAASGCDGFGTDIFTKHIQFGVAPEDSSTSGSSSSSSGGSGGSVDDDGDGLSNDVENAFEMEPRTADSDFDGYSDGLEFAVDSGDPLTAAVIPSSLNRTRTLLPLDAVTDTQDSDLDGLGDKFENDNGLDPESADTDGDGYSDGLELVANSNPFDAADRPERLAPPASDGIDRTGTPPRDNDGDGLSNDVESLNGTTTTRTDSDSDGFSDGLEFLMGSDPLSDLSIPNFFVPEPPQVVPQSEVEVEPITEEMLS